jgi:hypothetical protein
MNFFELQFGVARIIVGANWNGGYQFFMIFFKRTHLSVEKIHPFKHFLSMLGFKFLVQVIDRLDKSIEKLFDLLREVIELFFGLLF